MTFELNPDNDSSNFNSQIVVVSLISTIKLLVLTRLKSKVVSLEKGPKIFGKKNCVGKNFVPKRFWVPKNFGKKCWVQIFFFLKLDQ